jgi:hypothetical protein
MSEVLKAKVVSVKIKKTGNKNGKPWTIREIELDNGRKGDSFDEFTEGEDVEVEATPNSNIEYNDTFKKVGASAKKPFTKDWTFEKKRVALECATSLVAAGKVDMKNLVECRDKFFTYLNEK